MSAHHELGIRLKELGHLDKFELLTRDVERLMAEWDELLDLYEEAITSDEHWAPAVQDTLDIGTVA